MSIALLLCYCCKSTKYEKPDCTGKIITLYSHTDITSIHARWDLGTTGTLFHGDEHVSEMVIHRKMNLPNF